MKKYRGHQYVFPVVCMALIAVLLTACQTKPQKTAYETELERQYGPNTLWASSAPAPPWWNHPLYEVNDGAIYTIGVSRGYNEIRDAIDGARMDSAVQIAQYYNMKINEAYSDTRSIDLTGSQIENPENSNEVIKKNITMIMDTVLSGIVYVDQVELIKREFGENVHYARVRAKLSKDQKEDMTASLKMIAEENFNLVKEMLAKETDPTIKRQLSSILDSYRMLRNL